MKNQNRLLFIATLLATLVGLYVVPQLLRLVTHTPHRYPFVYYSSGLGELVEVDYADKDFPIKSLRDTSKYTQWQGDSLLPIFNYHQLNSKGLAPDSLEGVELSMPLIRSNTVVYRYNPSDFDRRPTPLYTLLESMPLRVGLESPNDVFRLDNRIEFIDAESNLVDTDKSERFDRELRKRNFRFPAVWCVGNPSTRKPYDEGYFCLDSNGQLFHLKMVNGRPFVRNTGVSDSIEIDRFSIYEASNKRFYGFVFSKSGDTYILQSIDGKYSPQRLDIPALDLQNDQMLVMGNLLYWTVCITSQNQRESYALCAETLTKVDTHTIMRTKTLWDTTREWLLPLSITMSSEKSGWSYPRLSFQGTKALILSLILALGYITLNRRKLTKTNLALHCALILATGIVGLLSINLMPKARKKTK